MARKIQNSILQVEPEGGRVPQEQAMMSYIRQKWFRASLLALLVAVSAILWGKSSNNDRSQKGCIHRLILASSVKVSSAHPIRRIIVPNLLIEAYKANPRATLEACNDIIRSGQSEDAI